MKHGLEPVGSTSTAEIDVRLWTERMPTGCLQPLLQRQWKYLWPKERVQLRRGQEIIANGWIDEITPDATTLWAHLDEGNGRIMVHQTDGIEIVRLEPQTPAQPSRR